MKKQFLLFLFALLPMLAMADDSGSCGTNVTYTFVSSTGTLTIQGSGEMTSNPWSSYKDDIKTVIIKEGVTSIGGWAFSGCSGLTSVTIPNSVMSIGWSAFTGCSGLTSVTIGNGVTSIGGDAFNGCSGLTSVTIPNSVTSIGSQAFADCSGLTSVNIPNSVTSIGRAAFFGTPWWANYSADPANQYGNIIYINFVAYKAISSTITSCEFKEGTISIGASAFSGCSSLTSITIPHSVTSIGASAFYGCSGLTSVTIPNSVTSIGGWAFSGCSGLTYITIPNSVTSIGGAAFQSCSGLTSVNSKIETPFTFGLYAFNNVPNTCVLTVPKGTRDAYIAAGWTESVFKGGVVEESDDIIVFADANVKALCVANWDTDGDGELSYDEAEAVTSIGTVFRNNTSITSFDELQYFTGLTSIGSEAFYHCSGLTSVTIPSSVTSIGRSAFRGCSGFASMKVESGNTKYDSRDNCNAIIETASNTLVAGCKNTIIPIGVTSIGQGAFNECSSLTSINIPTGVTSIGNNAFSGCGLTSVIIPDGVTSIGNAAFQRCSALTSITIPNSVESIGYGAFSYCSSLTSITIPEGVTSIGERAFQNCEALTSVTALNPSPVDITQDVFSNRTNATLFVPIGSKAAYEAADYWKEFKEIVEIGTPTNIVFADANVKEICVAHWDTNSDGELSYDEAAAVTTISDYFANNTSITSFDEFAYFTGVTRIYTHAFAFCSGLTSITIPNNVTNIETMAFNLCSSLTSITIPNNVTSIEPFAFNRCSGLTSIELGAENTKYDSRNSCNAIIETASNTLIAGCKNTIIPNTVTRISEGAFYCCTGLTSITIPNSVTSIGYHAFLGCTGLTSITIPNGLTSIGDYAFSECSGLTSVTIPNTVTSICEGAFADCNNLTSVTVDINTPLSITANTFTNRANATLYVVRGCKSAYEAANYWKDFGMIEEISVTIAMKTGSGAARNMIAYSSRYGLDFTDIPEIKAYIAFGYNWKNQVMMVHVKVVPPYTGMVIKTSNAQYDGGEYEVPTTTEDYYYSNLLVPVVETQTITPTETIDDVEYTNFAVGTLTGGGTGFVRLTSNWTATNKSYLRVPTSLYDNTPSARELGGFEVEFIEGEEATAILNAQRNAPENEGNYYDLQGRKVKPVSKGLYIHNGKKVFIK